MKFTLNSTALAEAITAASTSLPARPAAAILGGILVEARVGAVVLSSFNYERATIRTVSADVAEPDTVLVSGRLLAAVGGNLPKNIDSAVTVDGSEMVVSTGRTVFRLPLMTVEDYPELPAVHGDAIGTVDCAEFAEAITVIGGFASTDQNESLKNLTAINIEFRPGLLTLRATDRYMAARRRMAWSGDTDLAVDVAASDLLATIRPVASTSTGDVEILCTEGLFGLRTPSTTVLTRLLAVDFPNVDGAMRCDEHHCTATLHTAVLASMMKRAASIADDEYAKVSVSADVGALSVATMESTGGIADSVDADHQGEPHNLAVAAKRFHKAVSAIAHQKVTLGFHPSGHKSHMVWLYPGEVTQEANGALRPPDTDTAVTLMGVRAAR